MQDPYPYLIMAISGITALSLICFTALRAWQGWLDYKTAELEQEPAERAASSASTRIELANLRERLRKLEAIAAGVDI